MAPCPPLYPPLGIEVVDYVHWSDIAVWCGEGGFVLCWGDVSGSLWEAGAATEAYVGVGDEVSVVGFVKGPIGQCASETDVSLGDNAQVTRVHHRCRIPLALVNSESQGLGMDYVVWGIQGGRPLHEVELVECGLGKGARAMCVELPGARQHPHSPDLSTRSSESCRRRFPSPIVPSLHPPTAALTRHRHQHHRNSHPPDDTRHISRFLRLQ